MFRAVEWIYVAVSYKSFSVVISDSLQDSGSGVEGRSGRKE